MPAVRSRIEDAVVGLLADMKRAGQVAVLRPYQGELGAAQQKDEVMRALQGLAPGILVTTGEGRFHGVDVRRKTWRRDIEVFLLVAVNLQRSHVDRARAETQGMYALVDAILERLVGTKPPGVEGVGHFEPISEDVLLHDGGLCVWELAFELTVDQARRGLEAEPLAEVVARTNVADESAEAGGLVIESSFQLREET